MITAEEVDALLDCQYKEGSFGPPENGFNCWGLLHYVQAVYFGVQMPRAPIGDAERCKQMFADHVTADVWALVEKPEHGNGALMRGGDNPHVGIYLDFDGGGILHALEGVGVVFTTVDRLNYMGFARTKYYRLSNGG
jgi:cell wall-associated NlpC family hydrolase